MISLCSGVWPRRYYAAGGRQDHAERDLHDILQSVCGLEVCPRAPPVEGAATGSIKSAEQCQGGRSAA